MERITCLTEERIAAPAIGAPTVRRDRVGELSSQCRQDSKQVGSTPAADGPGLVYGDAFVPFPPTNDHAAMGRITWHGTPLGSQGAGYG